MSDIGKNVVSSTWRYVREARGHLTEVYEQLLDMPPPPRLLVGMHPDQVMVEARSVAAQEWDNTRFAAVMSVVETLNKYDVGKLIAAWREHAIEFLRKTPSVRARQKFRDDEDRILFLCVVLWYARAAVRWLEAREGEGQLRGGSSFRDMT
ncbi:MAG: hypothetical protein KGL65_10420, partial [Rhodospirillales bacterium]|nr:hypothetical protein [Rhodospirillales bacterium]